MSLFVKKCRYSNGKTYCSIVDGFLMNGKVKQKVIQKYGYLSDLDAKYGDGIKFLNSELERLKKEFQTKVTNTIDLNEYSNFDDDTFNIGYAYLKQIYKDFGIDDVLKQKQYSTNIEFSLPKACELLTYSRIINPGSIKYSFEHKNQFFEPFDLTLDDLYRSLKPILDCKENIFKNIWNNTKDKYNRDASTS